MRSLLLMGLGILLALGIFFARDRLRRACQIGAVLYAIVLGVRLLVYGFQDSENFLDVLVVGGAFLTIWGIGWVATQVIIEGRKRSERPPP